VQCARVRRCKDDHTLTERQSWGPSNNSGLRIVNWKPQSKTPPKSGTSDGHLYCILFIRIVSCHLSKNLSLDCVFNVTMNIYFCFYCNFARDVGTPVLLMFADIYYFNYTFIHATRTYRGTHAQAHIYD